MGNVKNYISHPGKDGDNAYNFDGTVKIKDVKLLATANELNLANIDAQTETILAAGVLSVVKRISKLALAGAGAVTIAAPDASMLGEVKIIEMTEDNGDVTIALTNVQGGSAATTCTWTNIGEALVLVAGITKWNVISEGGVVLS